MAGRKRGQEAPKQEERVFLAQEAEDFLGYLSDERAASPYT